MTTPKIDNKILLLSEKRQGLRKLRKPKETQRSETELDLSGPEESIGYNVRRADVYLREEFRRVLAQWNVRPVDYSILRLVQSNPGAAPAQIADALYIKRQNIGGLIVRLQELGWLTRGVHSSDRRRQCLHLTLPGSKRLAELARAASRMDSNITRGWTDGERAAFKELLQRLFKP